jgi:hypothetical protein
VGFGRILSFIGAAVLVLVVAGALIAQRSSPSGDRPPPADAADDASTVAAVSLAPEQMTPAPPDASVCSGRDEAGGVPADAFPGSACTGVPHGIPLRRVEGNLDIDADEIPDMYRIDTDGAALDAIDFAVPVCIFASDVTITRSRVPEAVWAAGPAQQGPCHGDRPADYVARNLRFVDVEIAGTDFRVSGFTSLHGNGITCVRCDVHDTSAGFFGSNLTIVDSYVHDLFGEPGSHNEAVLGFAGDIEIRRSNLVGILSPESEGGGVSASLALYTHLDWGPLDDVLVQNNRIEASTAVYCAYGGDSDEQDPTNIRFVDNVFVRNATSATCGGGGPIEGWRRGGGNEWTNNRFDDGEVIPEPETTRP